MSARADASERRWVVAVTGVAVVLCAASIAAGSIREADEVLHHLYAREVASVPMNLLHVWGRPLVTAALAPLSTFGFDVARWLSVAAFAVAAAYTLRAARAAGLRHPVVAPVALVMQPVVVSLLGGVWTELPFAALIAVWASARLERRHAFAGWICGLLPLVRPEGFLVGAVDLAFGLAGAWRTEDGLRLRWRSVVGIFGGTAAWAVVAAVVSGDPLWLVHHWPHDWAPASSWGRGDWWWTVAVVRKILPWTLIPVFVVGLMANRRGRMSFAAATFLFVLGVHGALWATGSFGSAGYARYFVGLSPLIALLLASGWDSLVASRFATSRVNTPVVAFVVLAAATAWLDGHAWERRPPPADARVLARLGAAIAARDPGAEAHAAHPFLYLGHPTTPAVRFEDMGDFASAAVAALPIGAWLVTEDRLYDPSTRNVKSDDLPKAGFVEIDGNTLGVDLSPGDTSREPWLAGFRPRVWIKRR